MKRFLATIVFLLTSFSSLLGQDPAPPATTPPTTPPSIPAPAPRIEAPPGAVIPPPAPESPVVGLTFRELIDKGGKTMYVLFGLSVLMFALIIYYLMAIRRGTVVSESFMKTADSLIRKQDYLGLLAVCNRRNECIAQITQKTLDFATKNPTATFDEVREVTQAEGQRQASSLIQRITYLADIGKVAPLVGLLGTVFGIINQFSTISQEKMLAAQLKFAGGVSEALLNTAGGLFIAIPSVGIYAIYRGRVSALISEMEAASTHIMALLGAQYKRVTAAAAAAAAANRTVSVKAPSR